ncbi:hypothetical protein CLOSTMETH_00115 [[Clostridium] methylpentosum DSM 5476]|uniref:Ribbon-helix-helix protein CopG domain-containing protein n=1 Tax=[Clostridium] methylpentosum DSM 5476 TaxID=537013 RepID=C0E8H0_9FIRM|nr:hypothetical protein CLOSTMETH_00115 [[Clostridium] methylpentosum DSM 5476]
MQERKKPGPHPEKPLEFEIKTRVDKETMQKIQYCREILNCNRSEVLRRGIYSLYEELAKK